MRNTYPTVILTNFLLCSMLFCCCIASNAQQAKQMVRIAKIQVKEASLAAYHQALKTQMQAAIKLEPGVISYHAVAEKSNPTRITIVEVYADTIAYQKHIQTKHFKLYKETVQDMVLSLELIDMYTIALARKENE